MSGHCFVHRIVQNFGREMVERAYIRAADIHARTATHRFKALEDLDVLGRIALGGGWCRVEKVWCLGH